MRFPSLWKVSILLPLITLAAFVSALAANGVVQARVTRATGSSSDGGFYHEKKLVSDLPNVAKFQDPNLVNAWGLSHSPTGPWFISDNGTGLSTQYKSNGMGVSPLAPPVAPPVPITIPPPSSTPGATAAPTGNVFNPTSDFAVPVPQSAASKPSIFMFATEDGTISGWNPGVDQKHAVLAVDNSGVTQGVFTGAVYKGLALVQTSSGNFLYTTNFRFGTVEQYDANFHLVRSFTDPDLNKQCDLTVLTNVCFAPFGIQNIEGKLFVTFALQKAGTPGQPGTFKHDDQAGSGFGFVDVFDTNGTLIRRFASGVPLSVPLNSPWGLALAPANFGQFSNDVLVGNFGDGRINAFDPVSGKFLGQLLQDVNGNPPITIDGLWGLAFGNGGLAGDTTTLFFASGPNEEADGLFGSIEPA